MVPEDDRPSLAAFRSLTGALWPVLAVALLTLIVRVPNYGNPLYHVDDQLYLLIGRAMLDGALPYVDIWDRKPPGLFLIYASIAALGGSGVSHYQLAAGVFAFATSFVLFLVARRFVNWRAALGASTLYLVSLEALAGGGGQAPVFYTLFVASAFLLVLNSQSAHSDRAFLTSSCAAMAFCSAAIFTKQTAVVESLALGSLLLAARWKRTAVPRAIAKDAVLYAAIGLFPWVLAAGYYDWVGHFPAFFDAVFVSILEKGPNGMAGIRSHLYHLLMSGAGLCLLALGGCFQMRFLSGSGSVLPLHSLFIWLGAAVGGFLLIPNFAVHYALPLVAPLSVISAFVLDRGKIGLAFAIPVISWMLTVAQYPAYERTIQARKSYSTLVRLIQDNLGDGGLFVFQGPPLLYDVPQARRLTRFQFPEHLNGIRERDALPVDQLAEVKRVLTQSPSVIVTGEDIPLKSLNPAALATVKVELGLHYRFVGKVALPIPSKGDRSVTVWVRAGEVEPGFTRAIE